MVHAKRNNKHDNLIHKWMQLGARIAAEHDGDVKVMELYLRAEINLPMTNKEKAQWQLNQKVLWDQATKHLLNQQKVSAIIIRQCTQRLQDTLYEDKLYALIERVLLKQMGDEYLPHNLMENLLAVLMLKQQSNQSNTQRYEKLNTCINAAELVGVQFDIFRCFYEHCCESRERL